MEHSNSPRTKRFRIFNLIARANNLSRLNRRVFQIEINVFFHKILLFTFCADT